MGGARRVATVAVLVALGLVLSFVERLVPVPAPVPGVKLGLANLVVVVALYRYGWREAGLVSAARVVLGGAMFGSGFSVVYALCGAMGAFGAMVLGKRAGAHVVTVSAVGGVAHNLGQLAVAAGVVGMAEVVYYLPVLVVSGVGTGVLIGAAAAPVLQRLPPR